ncbi:MAG: TonB-dependent receptor [Gammaproteobacteria bacterium]
MHSVRASVSRAVARALNRPALPWTVAAIALATPAWAVAADDGTLQEVIVTAQFRQENLQNTALAITAVSGEQLEQQGLTNVTDLGLVIPNASIRPQGSFSGPTPFIAMRGVQTSDYIFTSDPGVGVYIDDVYQGTLTGSAIDLLDLERVEVLRGPQGTLFGKNSLGGAIRLISKEPKGDDTGSLELTYGTRHRLDLRGIYDFKVTDKLYARVTGVSKQIDGYQDVLDFTCQMRANGTPQLAGIGDGLGADGSAGGAPNGQPDVVPVGSAADNNFSFPTQVPSNKENKGDCRIAKRGGSETNAGRLMFRYLATEKLELGLAADYSKTDQEPAVDSKLTRHLDTPGFNLTYDNNVVFPKYGIRFTADDRFLTGNPFTTYANPIDPIGGKSFPVNWTTEAWNVSSKALYQFTDTLNLSVIAGYRTYESDWMGDGDQMPIDLNHTYELQGHQQRSLEARLSGQAISTRLNWTAGAYRYQDHSHLGGYVTLPAFAAILPNFNENDTFTTKSTSAFLHGQFAITDALSVTAGGRYTDEKKTYAFDHAPYLIIPGELKYGSNHFDWKASMDYRFNPEAMVYGTVSTGFRSDGAQPRPFTQGQQRVPVPAEELTSYEIGTKLDLLDRRLRINLAVFKDDYDPRVFTSNGTQCNAIANLDPGPAFHFPPGGLCPAGTALAGTPGSPWIVYESAPGEDRGAELEITATPIQDLAINASLAWFDFKSNDGPTKDGLTNFGYVDPSYDVQAKYSGSLGVQYRFHVGGGSLIPRLDAFYQGSRSNGNQYLPQLGGSDNKIPGYTVANARISFSPEDNKWELALSAENLFDKFYWYALAPARSNINGGVTDNRTGSPARGREVALSFRRNFQ